MKEKAINKISLSDNDLLKYNKHILLDDIQSEGIEILASKHIVLIGLGGLGCPIAQYLATSGLGKLSLVDDDVVEITNLQRQILYSMDDIGQPKVLIAKKKLKALNPDLIVNEHIIRFSEHSNKIICDADLVIDASDNFHTRSIINKLTLMHKKPLVMGAAIKMQGQVAIFRNDLSGMPCYNCLYNDIDDRNISCIDQGVFSMLTGLIGSIQASESIKVLLNFGEKLESKLLLIDIKNNSFRTISIPKDNKCEYCN
tara:strand:- start:2865 stop:3632 length:768 start_codon:yes stop_codon:yes gene_type:complete